MVGALLTACLGVALLAGVFGGRARPHEFPFSLSDCLWLLINQPTVRIARMFGLDWLNTTDSYAAVYLLCVSVCINAVLFACIGALIGRTLARSPR
jgi:hypothetical protein